MWFSLLVKECKINVGKNVGCDPVSNIIEIIKMGNFVAVFTILFFLYYYLGHMCTCQALPDC